MKIGKMIGKGMIGEVYEWDEGSVIKLFPYGFDEDRIKHEAEVGDTVHTTGIPSPALNQVIDVNGRKGIILQRIFGKSILRHIEMGSP